MIVLARLVLIIIFLTLFLSINARGESFGPYLIDGTVTYLGGTDADRVSGETSSFLVAITSSRGLASWGYTGDEWPVEMCRYIDEDLQRPILFRFHSLRDNVGSILESRKRSLEFAVLQEENKEPEKNQKNRFNNLEVASFSAYPFALFLSSSYLGITQDEIVNLVMKPGLKASVKTQYGELTVIESQEGLLESIQFTQEADDLLTARLETLTVSTAHSVFSDQKMKRIHYACQFSPPLTIPLSNCWTATCLLEKEGAAGGKYRVENRVAVKHCRFDLQSINQEIDQILNYVPEGEEVQSKNPIEYIWSGRNIVKRVDKPGLALARSVRFQNQAKSWLLFRILLAIGIIGLLSLGGYFIYKQNRG
ncbi:hypothetical protein [Gimesia aquarii]|uniref:Uncharacterized protein n=1 Tax=Gimesia aquarii TaxID=2527964 RepID=A0A517VZY1_9PLAN|nr:hypothetical protein [Gimesia aquarii]QDT98562.1 hypothetical protein V144x_40690 [Gimesia aquarii]